MRKPRFSAEGCIRCPKRERPVNKSALRSFFRVGIVVQCPDCPTAYLVSHEVARRHCTQGFKADIPTRLNYNVCKACADKHFKGNTEEFNHDFANGTITYCVILLSQGGFVVRHKYIHSLNSVESLGICPYKTEHVICQES
jgi:hypothetical protein